MSEPGNINLIIDAIRQLRLSGLSHEPRDDEIAVRLRSHGAVPLRRLNGTTLWLGVPNIPLNVQLQWIGLRLGWWPGNCSHRRLVGVVSSRLSRDVGSHPEWFDLLRTLFCRLSAESTTLLTVAGTTAHRFVAHGAKLFDFQCLEVTEAVASIREFGDLGSAASQVVLSKPLLDEPSEFKTKTALRDRLLAGLAKQIWALRVAANSTTSWILRERLASDFEPGSTRLAVTGASAPAELVDAGVVPWMLTPGSHTTANADSVAAARATVPFEEYLVHWTRGPAGPWPDEPEAEYLDRLILGVETSGRSALAALVRILETQRLIASGHLIRGQHKVVCFSDERLESLPERRVYRRHLHRWDFEPYGVGIRRDILAALGARPVTYGQEGDHEALPVEERPFFQRRTTGSGTDWQSEKEWRLCGDLDLSSLDAADVFVFVATATEASWLRDLSSFPVVVVPGLASE